MSDPRIVVRKSDYLLELITDGGTDRFPVAIGKNPDGGDKIAEGDMRTPEGEFEIVSVEDSSEWEHEGARAYGPFFIRLACPPWEGIGIHGTDDPSVVGTKSTRGCVRMRNGDLEILVSRTGVGTRVTIVP